MAKTERGSEQAMIRLPDGMRDQLKAEAERNGRSMNAEIVARLEQSFQDPLLLPTDLLERVNQRASELRVPVRSLILKAIDKEFPLDYRLGEFIEKWGLRAAAASSRGERDRIIQMANDDLNSRGSSLSLTEHRHDSGPSEILIHQEHSGYLEIVATLPATPAEE